MKLIVWWIALMLILPLIYLFWWKKRWRLLLGVIILAVLAISYLVPSEFAFSKLTTEIEKEQPAKQLEKALKNISDDEPNSSDSKQLQLEKEIVRLEKKFMKFLEEKGKKEKLSPEEEHEIYLKRQWIRTLRIGWIREWGKKEKSPTFLFCGEQFNEGLSREEEHQGKKWQKVESHNIVDFGQSENNNPEVLKKKLQEIYEQNEVKIAYDEKSPVIWLKNIDKITNQEVKKELVKIVDPDQKNNLGEYYEEVKEKGKPKQKKIIDLSQFVLVATTSTANPELPKELKDKLKHVEPFLEKYKWVIFFSSAGVEIVVFVLLIRSRRKSKNKSLKHLEYY